MAGIRSTLIKEKNIITDYEATVITTDDVIHEADLEGKRTDYVIRTENKETPFAVANIDGLSDNVKTFDESVKEVYLVHIGKNLPVKKKAGLLAALIATKLKGEI